MLKIVFHLEDTVLCAEVKTTAEQAPDMPEGVVLPKQSGWITHVLFRTDDDLMCDSGASAPHSGRCELGELNNSELAALLALAAGLSEESEPFKGHDISLPFVEQVVSKFYGVIEPILERANCPHEGRPIP